MIELEKKEKEMIQALFTDFLREQPLSVVLSGQAGKDDFIRMRLRPVRGYPLAILRRFCRK